MGSSDDVSDASTDPKRFLGKAVRDQMANQGASQVWAEVTALAQLPGVLDLGQGWPDFGADDVARAAAAEALVSSPDPRANQYSGIPGRPELQSAVSRYYRSTGMRAGGDVLVTTSATEAIYVALQTLCDPGDEVVFLEPFFPWYISHCRIFGAVPVTVRMKPGTTGGGFTLDLEALREAFVRGEGRTKVFIHNSPHNPTGAVFTRQEMEAVAALCKEFDVVVLADEVYERCTFFGAMNDGGLGEEEEGGGRRRRRGSKGDEPVEVVRMADMSGMENRTLTIGTSSKLLCLSGWRVGWMMGPPELIGAVRMMHSYATFCAPTPLQLGVAAALDGIAKEAEDNLKNTDGIGGGSSGALVPDATAAVMSKNASVLAAALRDTGLRVFDPWGGYFLVADVAPLSLTSVEYCRQLANGPAKVAAVPLDVFYDPTKVEDPPPETFVRFAVCKKPETIQAAAAAIRANPV